MNISQDRSGVVPREYFLAALEYASINKTMTQEFMSKLADTYTVREGQVDYLACFRNYLNELISIMPSR